MSYNISVLYDMSMKLLLEWLIGGLVFKYGMFKQLLVGLPLLIQHVTTLCCLFVLFLSLALASSFNLSLL